MGMIWPILILSFIKMIRENDKPLLVRLSSLLIPSLILLAMVLLSGKYVYITWHHNMLSVASFFVMALGFHFIKKNIDSLAVAAICFITVEFILSVSIVVITEYEFIPGFFSNIIPITLGLFFYMISIYVLLKTMFEHNKYRDFMAS